MEYAAHLPSSRSMVVPLLALAIGAGGAVGIYAAIDDSELSLPQTRVVVTEPPAPLSEGVAAKNEAGTAAALAGAYQSTAFEGKDEAATAAAIAPAPQANPFKGKDEAATAAAIGATQTPSSDFGKDEAKSAAAIGSSGTPGGGPPAEARNQDPQPQPMSGARP
ncbi:MAG TPA: hypothetical protein VK307_02395 [Thermoleophilaceae bacterium]|nr:hypothetical protein [Thermoleophilaceae bacterium]